MFQADAFIEALSLVFSVQTMLWMCFGVFIGVAVGALPGLTSSGGVALMLPLSFALDTASMLGLLIGLYKGAIYGGSISAISFGTPGEPSSVATVYDGYKMMRAGKGRKALLMALYAAITGDVLSDALTIIIAPMLALVALRFGPTELFWIMVLAIVMLGALSGRHVMKGLLSAALGIYFGTIGTDPVGAVSRNTFDLWWLRDGIGLVPLVGGIFAMSLMLEEAIILLRRSDRAQRIGQNIASAFTTKGETLSWKEYYSTRKEMMVGLIVGTIVGILPGIGATVGSLMSYSVAKSLTPERKIGSGVIHGIAAAESGGNATVGPNLIPLLAFGIPGSSTAALIGGALIFHGATPGPRMFDLFPVVVYSLFIVLIIANLATFGIGRVMAFAYARIGDLPPQLLVPLIMLLAVIGSYAVNQNPYDVIVMLAFGFIGYGMRLFGIPAAPMVITFLVTPLAEASLRRALLINQGNWFDSLFQSPLAVALFLSTILFLIFSIRLGITDRLALLGQETETKHQVPDD